MTLCDPFECSQPGSSVRVLNCCHGARMLRRGPSYSSSNGTPCLLSYLLFKLTLGDDHFVREEISNHYVVHQELTVLQINYTSKTNTQSNKHTKQQTHIQKGVRCAVPGVRGGGQGIGWRQSNAQTSNYEG